MSDTISYHCTLPLKPQFRGEEKVPHMFVRSDFTCRDGSQKNAYSAIIKADQIGFRCFLRNRAVVKVECDLPKLLYGHNGSLIISQEQLDLAYDRLEHILKLFCEPIGNLGGFVPGRPIHENVYFTRVDFAWQFPDPDMRLALMMRHAVHPDIRNKNLQYPTGSTLPGTLLRINAYDKASKMKVERKERYLRLEVQMKGKNLRKLFTGDENTPLTSFKFMDAYHVYRQVLLQLDQPSIGITGETATIPEALAAIQLDTPDYDVASTWIKLRLTSTKRVREFEKDFTAALQDAADFRLADLLPERYLPDPHHLAMPEKEKRHWRQFVSQFDWPTGEADPLAPACIWPLSIHH